MTGRGLNTVRQELNAFYSFARKNNLRVCNCSTPAQLFHLLRRQAKQRKKPLILFTHKSLLRAEDAASSVADLVLGKFQRVIPDPIKSSKKTLDRLIFVSGKVYWDLVRYAASEDPKIALRLVRVEELYPFPAEDIIRVIEERPAKEIVWLQEEPRNQGAYLFFQDQMSRLDISVRYIGRAEAASPATGSLKIHKIQQASLLKAAYAPSSKTSRDIEISS